MSKSASDGCPDLPLRVPPDGDIVVDRRRLLKSRVRYIFKVRKNFFPLSKNPPKGAIPPKPWGNPFSPRDIDGVDLARALKKFGYI